MIRRMRQLLVRLLRPHLSDTALLAFDAGALPRASRRRAVRHLGQCQRCRSRFDELLRDLDAVAALFEKAAEAPAGAGQNWPALLETIRKSKGTQRTGAISPQALTPYLGRLAGHAGAPLPPGQTPADVLEALLGARAASCISGLASRRTRSSKDSLHK
jgi:anti-sigma factor RsiW